MSAHRQNTASRAAVSGSSSSQSSRGASPREYECSQCYAIVPLGPDHPNNKITKSGGRPDCKHLSCNDCATRFESCMVCMSGDGKTDKESAEQARGYLTIARSQQELKVHNSDPAYQQARQASPQSAVSARSTRAANRNAATESKAVQQAPALALAHSVPVLASQPVPALAAVAPVLASSPAPGSVARIPPLSDPFASFASKPAWKRAESLVPSVPVISTPPFWLRRSLQEAFAIPCRQFLSASTATF